MTGNGRNSRNSLKAGIQRFGYALGIAAVAAAVSACSGALGVDPLQSAEGTASLSIQDVPDGVTQIDLSVTGPDMEPVTATLTPGSGSAQLNIPPGKDRAFVAEAGQFTAETVTDIGPSGTAVTLAFQNYVNFNGTAFAVSDIFLTEVGPGNIEGTGRGFQLIGYSSGLSIDPTNTIFSSVDTYFSGTGHFFNFKSVSSESATLPEPGDYVYGTIPEPGLAGGDVHLNFNNPNTGSTTATIDSGTARISRSGSDIFSSFDMAAGTQPLTGNFHGSPSVLVPAAPNDLAATQDLLIVTLSWSDESLLETRYVLQRGINGPPYSTIAELGASAGGTLGFEDTLSQTYDILYYRVLVCRGEVCATSNEVQI